MHNVQAVQLILLILVVNVYNAMKAILFPAILRLVSHVLILESVLLAQLYPKEEECVHYAIQGLF